MFKAKYLRKRASTQVFVLFDDLDGVNRPVGVVTSQAMADAFYQAEPLKRDWIPFSLDEIPMVTGKPIEPIKPSPAEELVSKSRQQIDNTRGKVDETNRKLEDMLKKVKKKR